MGETGRQEMKSCRVGSSSYKLKKQPLDIRNVLEKELKILKGHKQQKY
jgi:hypothetical protein